MESRDILIEGKDSITIMTVGENAPVYVFGVTKSGRPYADIVRVMLLMDSEACQLAWSVCDCVQFGLTSNWNRIFVKMLNRMDEWNEGES